jgi:macrophage erythroblast attacher
VQSSLEFELRFQQLIEMVRNGQDPTACVTHIRRHLIPHNERFADEVQTACGLLAFIPYDANMPMALGYASLFRHSRWDELANLFTTAHNELLGLPSIPLLHVALSNGLSALKTPICHAAAKSRDGGGYVASTGSKSGQSSVCPICSPELKELAMELPYAHHSKSILANDLLVLPNGYVYDKVSLMEHAAKLGLEPDKIRDPRTKVEYPIDSAKRVYIT